jgi:hypothetical protein
MAVLIKFIHDSVAGPHKRPIISNDNGDCYRRVQSSDRENMSERAEERQITGQQANKPLAAAAARALAEAAERRKARVEEAAQREIGGRGGPDPARYGDWEAKGIAHDF